MGQVAGGRTKPDHIYCYVKYKWAKNFSLTVETTILDKKLDPVIWYL
jgi:hypothetical protein